MMLTLRACVTQISADAFNFAHVTPNFTVCYLPIMFARGKPTSLEKISEEELEAFVPFMILCSFNHPDNSNGVTLTVDRSVQDIFSGPKPAWWFKDLPFQYPLQISGMWRNKFAVLKSLVCRCYTYYNCEYILRLCAELAEECAENFQYQTDDENMLSLFLNGKFLLKFWKENMVYDSVVSTHEVVYVVSSSESSIQVSDSSDSDPSTSYTRKRKQNQPLNESLFKQSRYCEMSHICHLQQQSQLSSAEKIQSGSTFNCNQSLKKTMTEGSQTCTCTGEGVTETKESVLFGFGLTKKVKKQSVKKSKVLLSIPQDKNRKDYISKRAQLQIFQNVPVSSDLGRRYLERSKSFVCTDYHIDKIERYVTKDNHASVIRRSDVATSSTSGISDSCHHNTINYDEHNPLTVSQCSSRYYKFPGCKSCKFNLHKNMQKCTCLSGSAASKINYCYVQLKALPLEKLESFKSNKCNENIEIVSKVNKAGPSASTLKKEIEVIDLTEDAEENKIVADNEVSVVKYLANKPTLALKNYFCGTSDEQIKLSKRNDKESRSSVSYLGSDNQGFSNTITSATYKIDSVPISKEDSSNNSSGFNSLILKRPHQSKNFRLISGDRLILSQKDKFSKEDEFISIDLSGSSLSSSSLLSKKDLLGTSTAVLQSEIGNRSSSGKTYSTLKYVHHDGKQITKGESSSHSMSRFDGNLGESLKRGLFPVISSLLNLKSNIARGSTQNKLSPMSYFEESGGDYNHDIMSYSDDFIQRNNFEQDSSLWSDPVIDRLPLTRIYESSWCSSLYCCDVEKKKCVRFRSKIHRKILTEQAFNSRCDAIKRNEPQFKGISVRNLKRSYKNLYNLRNDYKLTGAFRKRIWDVQKKININF